MFALSFGARFRPLFSSKSHTINVSSVGGVQGSVKFPGLSAYSSSMGALTILTECLAEEFKDTKHRFNSLALERYRQRC